MNYRQFKQDPEKLKSLKVDERKILPILEEVVKDFAQLYELQLKDGFYPKDVTKRQLELAAEDDSAILSPFTLVYKEGKKLKTIPFHEKYNDLLLPISKKIDQAAELSKNTTFKIYLKVRAKSLIDGSYRNADIAWLDVKNSNLDFTVGPFERYLDKIFFIKRAFQAHVGIIDRQATEQANEVKEVLYATAQVNYIKGHSTEIPKKGVSALIENTPTTSGYVADVLFVGEHFPCDLEILQLYGSRVVLYKDQADLKFDKLWYPIFQAAFEKRFASKYSKKQLREALDILILLSEMARQLHKFPGSRERLQELFGPIDEANGFAAGIQHSKHLVVKGLISQDQLEAVIIMHIVRILGNLLNTGQSGMEAHVRGYSIALRTYLEEGGLSEKNGISWPNFSKIFFEIEGLADKLTDILQFGSYADAKRLIDRTNNAQNLANILKALKKLTSTL